MPTPIGHALGAFAAGWLVAGPPSRSPDGHAGLRATGWSERVRRFVGSATTTRAAIIIALGVVADLDLLFGIHSGYTHSVGAAALAALGVAALVRTARLRMAWASAAAYLSHVALDIQTQDTSAPLGVMALWPFSTRYFYSGLDLFFAVDRRYWLPGFWVRDLKAVAWEVLLLAPLAWLAWRVRRRAPRQ
jgi:inner membrane protein